MPQDMGPGLSARAFPGQGQGTPWPQMTPNDVQREGQTLPATLPSGIHLDDWNLLGVPDSPKTGPKLPTNYGNSQSTGSGRASGSLPGRSLAGRPELGTHAPFSEFNSVKQGHAVRQ
ncbi:unnamed protein product [Sphagnum jensenii]